MRLCAPLLGNDLPNPPTLACTAAGGRRALTQATVCLTLKQTEDRDFKRYLPQNSCESIRPATTKLSNTCVAILGEALEDTGCIGMDRRLAQQRSKKQVPHFWGNMLYQATIGVYPPRILAGIENTVIPRDISLISRRVQFFNEPWRKEFRHNPVIQFGNHFRKGGKVNRAPVAQIAA